MAGLGEAHGSDVFWGASIEAGYVRVRLVRSVRSQLDYGSRFMKLKDVVIGRDLKEQIR